MSIPASATADVAPALDVVVAREGGSRVWARLRTHPSAMVGIAILLLYVVAGAAGPLLLHYDPVRQNLLDAFLPGSPAHPLGTDDLGRDELARLLYGTRYTLVLGFAAVAIGLAGRGPPPAPCGPLRGLGGPSRPGPDGTPLPCPPHPPGPG